jgi:serine/threonine-protein phosphatase 2B catalytic subunit
MPYPATKVPTDAEFYSKKKSGLPDLDFLKQHFLKEGRLTETQAAYILSKASELLRKEPNILEIDSPLTGKFLGDNVAPS